MGRLIDADKMISYIDAGHLRNPNELCFSENDIVEMIKNQQTAYNVEKVVDKVQQTFENELAIALKGVAEGEEYTEEAYRIVYLNDVVKSVIHNGGEE
jgi:hypothetical protein